MQEKKKKQDVLLFATRHEMIVMSMTAIGMVGMIFGAPTERAQARD